MFVAAVAVTMPGEALSGRAESKPVKNFLAHSGLTDIW
jgi:hypothetical protein